MTGDRRTLLQQLLVGTLAAVAVPNVTVALASAATGSNEQKSWQVLKETLASEDVSIEAFKTTFEAGVQGDLQKVLEEETKGEKSHNPRLVEPLLGEISALLDRCVAYRREGAELELRGVEHVYESVLLEELQALDKKIAKQDPGYVFSASLAASLPEVATSYDINAKGDAARARSDAKANAELAAASLERNKDAIKRLLLTQGLERDFRQRHLDPGNAHNFSQRFTRLRVLFNADLASAYRRCFAAEQGLKYIFGISLEFPKTTSGSVALDDLVLWTREVMRALTRKVEYELEYEFTVPLTDNYIIPFDWGNQDVQANYKPEKEFKKLVAKSRVCVFQFDLKSQFAGMDSVRLRAVGASYIGSKKNLENPKLLNAKLRVNLVTAGSDGEKVRKPELVILKAVGTFGSPIDYTEGSSIYDIDPRGIWTIRIHEKMWTSVNLEIDRDTWVQGLYLHFKVAAVPSDAPIKWIKGVY